MSDVEMIAGLYRRRGREWIVGALAFLDAYGDGGSDALVGGGERDVPVFGPVVRVSPPVVASVRDSGEYDFDSGADPERPKSRAELLAELAAEGTLQRDLGNGPGITYDQDGNPTMTAVPPIPFDESIYDRDNRAGFNDHRH